MWVLGDGQPEIVPTRVSQTLTPPPFFQVVIGAMDAPPKSLPLFRCSSHEIVINTPPESEWESMRGQVCNDYSACIRSEL